MSKSDPGALFAAVNKKREGSVNNEIVLPTDYAAGESEAAKKKDRKKGKRSDPNYKQTGVYLPKDLTHRVKKRLYDHDIDFSDLIADLLAQWEAEEAAKDN
ncbi:MAG: hypothetical protein ACFB0D_22135 [Phormidesmis sp.]